MTTLAEVHATTTPGLRAQAATRLIDQHQRDITAAREIIRAAIVDLIMHGASDSEIARLCAVPEWMADRVRRQTRPEPTACCGHRHTGPALGGICIGCACGVRS